MASSPPTVSSDHTVTPHYTEPNTPTNFVEEPESDAGSDTVILEHLIDLLSLDGFKDDDADTISTLEWQSNTSSPSLVTSFVHTARTPVRQQAEWPTERIYQPHATSGPECWICLSIGWPQDDVSFRCFGMVHWSHTPYVSFDLQYVLPQASLYSRTFLGPLNGIPEYDVAGFGDLFYPDSLLSLP